MKLSKRVQNIKESPTLAITNKAQVLQSQGVNIIGFGAGEPDFDTPQNIKEAAISAIQAGFTKYTAVGGIPDLKDAIIEKLKKDNHVSYAREEILVSNGGKHVLYNIAQALFEAGDEVIIPAPFWVSYPDQVILNDATPVIISTKEENAFKLTPSELEAAITPKTKAFILNSPSNPTGSAYSKGELTALAKILKQHKVLCISDEIYEKVVYDHFQQISIASIDPEIKAITIIVNGVSKAYSMTGWRMGWAAGPKEIISAMGKIQGQVTSNICSITQKACIEAYRGPQNEISKMVVEFKNRRDFIVESFNAIPGLKCLKPEGSFYVFPNVKGLLGKKTASEKIISSSDDFANYLLEEFQVAVVPGEGFGAPGYMRLSYAISMEKIKEGMERIKKAVSSLKQ